MFSAWGWRCACALGIILWLFCSHFFCFVNLVFFFQFEMLSKCIDSGYIVGATPLTVFLHLFWNFADVFGTEWRCACDLGITLWLLFLTHILYLLCCTLSIHYNEVLKRNIQYFAIIRVFISAQEWAFEYCFGNKKAACWKHGCKGNCVLSSYTVPTVLYTEV